MDIKEVKVARTLGRTRPHHPRSPSGLAFSSSWERRYRRRRCRRRCCCRRGWETNVHEGTGDGVQTSELTMKASHARSHDDFDGHLPIHLAAHAWIT